MFLFHNDLSHIQCIDVSISFPSSNEVLEEKFKIWFCFVSSSWKKLFLGEWWLCLRVLLSHSNLLMTQCFILMQLKYFVTFFHLILKSRDNNSCHYIGYFSESNETRVQKSSSNFNYKYQVWSQLFS